MAKRGIFIVAITVSACSSAPKVLTAPAPANALECSLASASAAGFSVTRGGISDGYLSLRRSIANNAGERTKEVASRIASMGMAGSNRSTADDLYVVNANGILRITPTAIDEHAKQTKPTKEGEAVARTLISTCGSQQ